MRTPGSTSLTAYLERAAATKRIERGSDGPSILVLEDDGERCTASAARGQRCSRRVRTGQTLCSGHAAMAASTDA
jgi:hypothetical protein